MQKIIQSTKKQKPRENEASKLDCVLPFYIQGIT